VGGSNVKGVMILTQTQAKVLAKLMGNSVKEAADQLDMKPSAIYMNNTRVYQKFLGLLKVMIDNYPVFERRLKKNKATYGELRHLARLVKGEVKKKE